MTGIAYTTNDVIANREQIHFVFHDSDGDWQFLPNRSVSNSDICLVTIGEILELDPSLGGVLSLPRNFKAERLEQGEWSRMKT